MPEARQIITFIIGSAVVIFGAYFATYLVASSSQRVYKGRVIRVVDRFSLAKDKSIVLLSVYDKVYLVAFSSGAVTLLDNLDPEKVSQLGAEDTPSTPLAKGRSWAKAITRLARQLSRKKPAEPEASIPFELYLQQEQQAGRQNIAENQDNLDIVYAMMKNRQGKEDQHNAFADNAYFEEDILK